MTHRAQHLAFLWVFTGFLFVFFWALNVGYPLIGHDYLDFFPQLLEGKWYFLRQGIAPFRYTPHLCGGLPQYGNPQDMYYSLPQAFFIAGLDLWHAVQLSIGVVLLAGYWGWYRFGRDAVSLERPWAHLLALVIIANGSYLMHMIVGHLTFHSLPLMGILLWLIFEKKTNTRTELARKTSFFALLTAYILFSGGFFALMFFALTTAYLIPIDLLIHQANWKKRLALLLPRLAAFGIGSVLIGASKLVAVYSFIRFFPRHYPFDALDPSSSILLFIARAFWYIPQGRFLFAPAGVQFGVHEYSMFLSPVTLMGLIGGIVLLSSAQTFLHTRWKMALAVSLYALFLLIFFAQLTRGSGFLVTPLQALPVLRSIHVTQRFLYALSILVSIMSIWCIAKIFAAAGLRKHTLAIGLLAGTLTALAIPAAYIPLLHSSELLRNVHYENVRRDIKQSHFVGRSVSAVTTGMPDIWYVLYGNTGLRCQEVLFGYGGERQITSLTEGPVDKVENGFFNLNNPACFQYPEENSCLPGDRIAVTDRMNFERFRRGERTTWNVSAAQRAADGVSLVALVLSLLMLLSRFSRKKVSL